MSCQLNIFRYARLAAGANYALLKAKTVAQFANKAAFGLAIKKRYRDGEGWAEDWYYQADLLWARVSGNHPRGAS